MAIDLDQFEHTAAWLEYCDGLSRFEAENEAARRQGVQRWEVAKYAKDSQRDIAGGGHKRQAAPRHAKGALPRVQSAPQKES